VHARSEEKPMIKGQICEELEQVFDHFLKYHMNNLLGDFNGKMERENIFKLTVGNENLRRNGNGDGVRIMQFATPKNLVVKSTIFSHRNLHTYNWTSPDGNTHNQTVHILIDRRWHSSILDVRSFREAACDNDHYLVVAKLRERLAVSKQAAQKFDGEIFNLRKLHELEVRKQNQIEITKRFVALGNLIVEEDTNRDWESIKGNIKTSAKVSLDLHELKQHNPWFDEQCLHFLEQRSRIKCSAYRI